MPLAICSWLFGGDQKEILLTEEEKSRTKRIITALDRLDRSINQALPIAFLGLAGWAAIWLYRGLTYPAAKCKNKVPLNKYITDTHRMARIFGLTMTLGGLLYLVSSFSKPFETHKVDKVEEKIDVPKVNRCAIESKEKEKKALNMARQCP